jgi:hypothetical protein
VTDPFDESDDAPELPLGTWHRTVTSRRFTADMNAFRRQFEQVTDSVTSGFSVIRSGPTPDQREEDRVTTTEEQLVVNEPVPALAVNVVPEPFFLTRGMLRQLGSCGTYVRKFSDAFPLETYPDGVEINAETCGEHYQVFDWEWALHNMLNYEGRVEHDRRMRSRSEENRRFGTGNRRRAAVFGHVFATRVEWRHEAMATLRDRAAAQADQDAIAEVSEVQRNIAYREQEIVRYQNSIEQLTAMIKTDRDRLPALEAAAAGPLQRQAELKQREAVAAMERMRERFEKSKELVAAAVAEVERFGALVAAQQTNVTGE